MPHSYPFLSRRNLLLASLAGAVTPLSALAFHKQQSNLVAGELKFPEGPLIDTDGSVILSEILAGQVTRIAPDGSRTVIARMGNGGKPIGLAAGPDGALYVTLADVADDASPGAARGGRICRIDPVSRALSDIVIPSEGVPLITPDDLVFDGLGGFYFTDMGIHDRNGPIIEQTGIYYFDGKRARLVSGRSIPTNGIDLSPDGRRLYWTEYITGRLFSRNVTAPGVLAPPSTPNGDCLYVHPAPITLFDSLRVDREGCVSVAVHEGTPTGKSGIMSFSANGVPIEFIPFPDPKTSSLALRWSGAKVAYVTVGGQGRLFSVPWPRYGKQPVFLPSEQFRLTPPA